MTAKPNDASFRTSGGGSPSGVLMDLSQVTQSDGTTVADRERVVPGGDDGTLQTFAQGPAITAAMITDIEARNILLGILRESRKQTALLRILCTALGATGTHDVSSLAALVQGEDQ